MEYHSHDSYSHTFKGCALYTLNQWRWFRDQPTSDEESELIRTGRMVAYADVLKQMTGRNVATEEGLVTEIILAG